MIRSFFQVLAFVIAMCSSFIGAKTNEQQLTPKPTEDISLSEVITNEVYTPNPTLVPEPTETPKPCVTDEHQEAEEWYEVTEDETIFEYEEEGITLSKCLKYRNEQWRGIEKRFEQEVLMTMPHEYKLYDASELSTEIIENRNGMVIVERCIGFVTNKTTGAGKVLNPYSEGWDYISYSSVSDKYCDGTVFISYMIYNPENNYVDDIIDRYDFVLCREYED